MAVRHFLNRIKISLTTKALSNFDIVNKDIWDPGEIQGPFGRMNEVTASSYYSITVLQSAIAN